MRGIGFLGVNPSAEGAEEMSATARRAGISFPWLIDEDQRVARRLGVRRLPDFLVFNRDRRLAYHGRFDGTDRERTSAFAAAPTGEDLRLALDLILRGEAVPVGFPARGHLLEWTEQPQVERAAAVEAG